jgi:hypothetical protein
MLWVLNFVSLLIKNTYFTYFIIFMYFKI